MPVTSASDDLEAVAEQYRTSLGADALLQVDITPYDRCGVPTVATTWAAGGVVAHGTGFGASMAAATVGALGELAEAVLVNPVVAGLPRRRAGYRQLVADVGPDGVVDPVTLVLEAGSDYSPDRPLDWVPMTRWRTGQSVLVPLEFVASEAGALPPDPPPGGWLTTAITNGLGAGTGLEQAVTHALLETVQRDGDTVSYRALDTGVVVDLSASTDPGTRALLEQFRSAAIDPLVKLASTELATVVYCAGRDDGAGSDPQTFPLAVTAMGEAAALDRDGAVRKALLEYGSSRARKAFAFGPLEAVERRDPAYLARELSEPVGPQEPRALREMTAWCSMAAAELSELVAPTLLRRTETVALHALPSAPEPANPAARLEAVLDRLAAFDVLVLPAGEDGGSRAAKVVVPGLEVETVSYLRIGERALRRLLDRGSDLVGLGMPTRPSQLPVHLTAEATERVGGPAWLDRDTVDRTVGRLYPLYREPDRFALQRLARGERPGIPAGQLTR